MDSRDWDERSSPASTSSARVVRASTCSTVCSSSSLVVTFSRPSAERRRLAVRALSSPRCSETVPDSFSSSCRASATVPCTSLTISSESRAFTRAATSSASPASESILSNSPMPLRPSSTSPQLAISDDLPGITSATRPPRSPLALSSTTESFGTGYSPSISRRTSTSSVVIRKPRMRPMLTPRICTGSPLRIPPASGTIVLTM